MLGFLKTEANKTYTENGAATYISTKSDCLDLFATIGALRHGVSILAILYALEFYKYDV